MKKISAFIAGLAVLVLVSCGTAPSGRDFYSPDRLYHTQVNLWTYGNEVDSLNYSVEVKLPVNTPVWIDRVTGSYILFTPEDSNTSYKLINNPKYTNLPIEELFARYFGEAPVNLDRFPEIDRNFIKSFDGFYSPGVSKEAVLIGRGYPPSHRTPSLDSDIWIYWRNRWASKSLEFKDGRTAYLNGKPIPPR